MLRKIGRATNNISQKLLYFWSKQASIPRFQAKLAAPRPGAEEVLVTVHEPARLSFTASSRTTFVTDQFYILITRFIAEVLHFSLYFCKSILLLYVHH